MISCHIILPSIVATGKDRDSYPAVLLLPEANKTVKVFKSYFHIGITKVE